MGKLDAVSALGTVGARDPLKVTLHSKVNNWIALLFLIVVFNVFSSLASKLVALVPWMQGLDIGPAAYALLRAAIGVTAAAVATFILGNLLAEQIPLRPPLSSLLMSGKLPEIARRRRIVATVALLILMPVVQTVGLALDAFVPLPSSSSAVPAKEELGRDLFAPSSQVDVHGTFVFSRQLADAKSGNIVSQRMVGVRYLRGNGVQQDFGQAFYWLNQAAQRSDVVAMSALAEMYHDGEGIPRNDSYALQLFIRAAQQGSVVAQINLADMLAAGEGGPPDVVSAYAWYSIASTAAGTRYPQVAHLASERIDALALLMARPQIAEAQRQAAVWWASHR